jgi:hypothetical protein
MVFGLNPIIPLFQSSTIPVVSPGCFSIKATSSAPVFSITWQELPVKENSG